MKFKLLAVAIAAAISTPVIADDSVKAGKGFKINDTDVSFEVGGRLQYDIDWFDGAAFANGDVSGSDTELRRTRLFIKGKIGKDWEAKLQADYKDDGSTGLADAYIRFKGWEGATLTVGKQKTPFGLEIGTSSKDITAIERTMSTNAFTAGRQYGVSLSNASRDFTWAVGLYDFGDDNDHVATGFMGRVTFAPIVSKNEVLHLGFGLRQNRLAGDAFSDADQRVEIHTADSRVGAGTLVGQSFSAYNAEIAYSTGSFHTQVELFDGTVDGGNLGPDTDLSGYYAQVGYILTGESRPYKNGVFKRVKPKGDAGAWEVFGRFSNYEPADDEAEAFTLGLNYYANSAVRVGINYVTGDVTEGGVDVDGDALAVRFQYVF